MRAIVVLDAGVNFDCTTDCSTFLIKQGLARGHQLWACDPSTLTLKGCEPFGFLRRLELVKSEVGFAKGAMGSLNFADIVLMRGDPPVDMRYITVTYILEHCEGIVINNPVSVRNTPEKLSALKFATLPTLVSSDLRAIEDFCNCYDQVVLKPAYDCGGRGVQKILGYDEQLIVDLVESTGLPIVVQQFCSVQYDKRVVLLNGEVLGVYARVPAEGDFRANICQGGKAIESELDFEELAVCADISDYVKKNDLFFVGLDLINGYVTELNVTSPMGLIELKRLYGKPTDSLCWDFFEDMLKS